MRGAQQIQEINNMTYMSMRSKEKKAQDVNGKVYWGSGMKGSGSHRRDFVFFLREVKGLCIWSGGW
jgi:hypothetical protein